MIKRLSPNITVTPITPSPTPEMGVSLEIPRRLVRSLRADLIHLINRPSEQSPLKTLLDQHSFVVLDLTLTPKERSGMTGLQELDSEKNHSPLFWHKDGGSKRIASFSALFSDTKGPPRLSRTAISRGNAILPSLIESADTVSTDFVCDEAPEELIHTWKNLKRMLTIMHSRAAANRPDHAMLLGFVLRKFIDAVSFAVDMGYMGNKDLTEIIQRSIEAAKDSIYTHEWQRPQTLLISNSDDVIHCRVPEKRAAGVVGGKLFAKPVFDR